MLQIPMDFHGVRRHTTHGQADDAAAAWPLRRQSLQPKGSSPTGVVDSCAEQEVLDASLGCRRRSFSVTPKGDIVNEGDEILPLQGFFYCIESIFIFVTLLYFKIPDDFLNITYISALMQICK